jgi:energy-coupling factor transporter ATP-binding protein EcfA2
LDDLTLRDRDLVESFGINDENRQDFLPAKTFLPLQIALPELGTWLATGPGYSDEYPGVLHYLCNQTNGRNAGLHPALILAHLSVLPALLIFDGFDEIGSTEDRTRVVKHLRELINWLAINRCTAQVVATTRPQGYAGELEHIGVHLHQHFLVPLEKDEAIAYAQKLIDAKIALQEERDRMMVRLTEAANHKATARLLTTPLQITILAALIQQIGRAPRERWNLFYQYFNYSYNREIERDTYASSLLATFRPQIEQIHARVGLILQIESERDGGAAARMPRSRLLEVINGVLAEDEFDAREQESLAGQIANAAEMRLVFLVEPEPDAFGFEIRSLQEFMAAWAITSGREQEIALRIEAISTASIFRNVMLFVASRLYSEGLPLRDSIAEKLCKELDERRPTSLARTGAILALEVLEEGAVLSQPKRSRGLMERAVGVLQLPPNNLHARLAAVANSDTSEILYRSLESGLANDHKVPLLSQWICLLELINLNHEHARSLAEKYWPQLQHEQSLLTQLARANVSTPHWLLNKLEADLTHFNIGFLSSTRVSGAVPSTTGWATWFAEVLPEATSHRRNKILSCNLIRETDLNLPAVPRYPVPDLWEPFLHFVRFEYQPNPSNLVRALESIAAKIPSDKWADLFRNASWPVASILRTAADKKSISRHIDLLKEGRLGSEEAWRLAQKDWTPDSLNITDLKIGSGTLPWTAETLKRHPPVVVLRAWVIASNGDPAQDFGFCLRAILGKTDPRVKSWLASVAMMALGDVPASEPIPVDSLRTILRTAPSEVSMLFPRPACVRMKDWLTLIGENAAHIDFAGYCPEFVLKGPVNRASIPSVLLEAAVLSIDTDSNDYWGGEGPLPVQISQVLHRVTPRNERDQLFVLILKIYFGSISDPDVSNFEVLMRKHKTQRLMEALAYALNAKRSPWKIELYLSEFLLDLEILDQEVKLLVIRNVAQLISASKTGLQEEATLGRLSLVHLDGRVSANDNTSFAAVAGLPTSPIWLKTLELKAVGRFESLKLELVSPKPHAGQWVVILGKNGVGKSTILRSVTLALRNARDVSIWPPRTFSREWVKMGAPDAQIRLVTGGGAVHQTYLFKSSTLTATQNPEQKAVRQFPIFAYGCRRGSALGGTQRQVEFSDGSEIASLMDEGATVIHAETWLKDLEAEQLRDPERSGGVYQAVIAALCEMICVRRIWVENRRVWIEENNRNVVPFSELSDGYLTAAGWFVDLIARWIELAGQRDHRVGPAFLKEMTGLVLIDEIDLHLHPSWQVEIIKRTRQLLPKLSFIVTTHNPLTLVGATADEIWILHEEAGGVVATQEVETPLMLTGGQLYTRYFGIEDVYPDEIGREMQRFMTLAATEDPSESEASEFENLKRSLASNGVSQKWIDNYVEAMQGYELAETRG